MPDLRRGGAKWQNLHHDGIVRTLGDGEFQRAAVRHLWENGRFNDEKHYCAVYLDELREKNYTLKWRRSDKLLEARRGTAVNYFEVFGGKDEASFMLIQGRTLAGVLLDEVVLMTGKLCQPGACPLLGGRRALVVQLQPRQPVALVQNGLD